MKTTLYALTTLTILTFLISCKSDDDAVNDPTTADLMVGSWDMTQNTVNDGNADVTAQGITINTDFAWTGSNFDYQLTFSQDGQVSEEGNFDLNVSASILGQPYNQLLPVATSNMADVLASGTYEVRDNQLITRNNGKAITVTIVEVTESILRLRFNLAEASPEQFNISGAATGTNDIIFSRK